MATLIEIRDLNITVNGKHILKNINLDINEVDSIGIIGKSGAGKSTLLHLLRGFEEFEEIKGEVIFNISICPKCSRINPPSNASTACSKCGTKTELQRIDYLNSNGMHSFEYEGKTAVLLGSEQRLLGILAVADKLRAETREAIKTLKSSGMKVVMLTGDNETTAKAIASLAGVDEYLSQLLPEDKVEAVRKLKERFGKVAMVGDGINDAPAMAVSDVGIAMGAAGTDIAIETGDIVLMSDDLSKIDYALRLSRRTIGNIRQNVIVSLAIITFLVPLALIGWIGLVPGLILNEASGLIAIVNALRLLR